jgi:mannitol-1-phosphate/altronate dehydrogenase
MHPYEEAKIRILNATHNCIAWAGTLAGHTYIHEGTHDAGIRRFAHDYVTQDVIPCLTPSPLDLERYRDVVLERFGNPYVLDTNQRVAADGFSKIPASSRRRSPNRSRAAPRRSPPRCCPRCSCAFWSAGRAAGCRMRTRTA